nr:oligosaccharide flippase family protein [Cytobacillus firmus]
MNRLVRSNFIKSITVLTSGSIIAQIITLIASPVMTRLYTPDEIGMYTLIITVISMFSGVICGRYDMAIVSEKSEENVFALIKLSFLISLCSSIFVSLGFSLYYEKFNTGNQSYMFLFVFVLLLTAGIGLILNAFNNRNKEYNLMTTVLVFRTFMQNITMIVFGLIKVGSIGLILSQLIGQVFGLRKQGRAINKYLGEIKSISKNKLLLVAKLHFKQPIYSVPAIFANSFSYSSINFFVGHLFGLTNLAYYFMSYRILGMPLTVISNNVSRVFFQEASREFDMSYQYKKTFLKTSIFLTIIAIPMVICMYFLAPPLFEWFFGEGWGEAGVFVKILAPMFGIRFIVSPLTTGMIISGKQSFEFAIQILFLIFSIFGYIVVLIAKLTIYQYLTFISIAFSLVYIVYYLILYRYSAKIEID